MSDVPGNPTYFDVIVTIRNGEMVEIHRYEISRQTFVFTLFLWYVYGIQWMENISIMFIAMLNERYNIEQLNIEYKIVR